MSKLKELRGPRLGWAPGGYWCMCKDCRDSFVGAKLATQCADCAYAADDPVVEPACATELEYLKWFRLNADFGPGEGDVIRYMHKNFVGETGKQVPKGWRDDE